jgi:hypothetical protein
VGATGPAGQPGPAGPPGIRVDAPFVRRVNWRHDQPHRGAILRELQIELSDSLDSEVLDARSQLVQVWFEPDISRGQRQLVNPLWVLNGELAYPDERTMVWTWALSGDEELVKLLESTPGRVLIRVHCNLMTDRDRRVFSSTPDALLRRDIEPHLPGGVLESWIFLRAG